MRGQGCRALTRHVVTDTLTVHRKGTYLSSGNRQLGYIFGDRPRAMRIVGVIKQHLNDRPRKSSSADVGSSPSEGQGGCADLGPLEAELVGRCQGRRRVLGVGDAQRLRQ